MTEHEIQTKFVKLLKSEFPGCMIIANPFSEMQLHTKSDRAKYAALAKAKAAGWQRGVPDIILGISEAQSFHLHYIELKTDERNPFRRFNNSEYAWLEKTHDQEARAHVLAQLDWMQASGGHHVARWFLIGEPDTVSFVATMKGKPRWDEFVKVNIDRDPYPVWVHFRHLAQSRVKQGRGKAVKEIQLNVIPTLEKELGL